METRSRKSRSLTPFSVEKFSQEFVEKESLAENSVGVTRQTTTYKWVLFYVENFYWRTNFDLDTFSVYINPIVYSSL